MREVVVKVGETITLPSGSNVAVKLMAVNGPLARLSITEPDSNVSRQTESLAKFLEKRVAASFEGGDMKWTLHASRVVVNPSLREHIDRRLNFALSRFAARIGKIDVFLVDQNGPKGGLDKSALIAVRIRGMSDVMAHVVDSDWVVTIDRVTTRVAQQLRRELERSRKGFRNRTQSRHTVALGDRLMDTNPRREES